MQCFSSRVTSWLTRTLRVGGCVLRRRIGASVIRPSRLGWPTQQQRRPQEAVAVLGSQKIPWDRHGQIERKFCTIVGGVISPCLSNIYLHHVLDEWFEHMVRPRLKLRPRSTRALTQSVRRCHAQERAWNNAAARFGRESWTIEAFLS